MVGLVSFKNLNVWIGGFFGLEYRGMILRILIQRFHNDIEFVITKNFNMLPNCKHIIIHQTLVVVVSFNMFNFLNIILQTSKWRTITIRNDVDNKEPSWISKTWLLSSKELTEIYDEKQLLIEHNLVSREIDGGTYLEDSITIKRMN